MATAQPAAKPLFRIQIHIAESTGVFILFEPQISLDFTKHIWKCEATIGGRTGTSFGPKKCALFKRF
jgi:hypothetical protein